MNIQQMINNAMKAQRADSMKESEQLTLGELILKLESVKDKNLPVYFDDTDYRPKGFGSWRGSYCELYLGYEDCENCYDKPKEDCQKDDFGDHDYDCPCGGLKEYSTELSDNPSVDDLLKMSNLIKGKLFYGYKGGDFIMGEMTPIWVANYGNSSGFKESEDCYTQAIIDVVELEDRVCIITALIDY